MGVAAQPHHDGHPMHRLCVALEPGDKGTAIDGVRAVVVRDFRNLLTLASNGWPANRQPGQRFAPVPRLLQVRHTFLTTPGWSGMFQVRGEVPVVEMGDLKAVCCGPDGPHQDHNSHQRPLPFDRYLTRCSCRDGGEETPRTHVHLPHPRPPTGRLPQWRQRWSQIPAHTLMIYPMW